MNEKDKDLLLKDLCARLPYGVKLLHIPSGETTMLEMMNCDAIDGDIHDMINNFQPYLRPLSSMMEEEEIFYNIKYPYLKNYEQVDWLNKNMFDYRGLIAQGLALEAPEGMYNLKD